MRLFAVSRTYRFPAASTATLEGSVSPADKSRPGPCTAFEKKSRCPITLSAWFPLVRLPGLRHARTRLLAVSATYNGPPDRANAIPKGVFSSRPSIRLDAPDVGGFRSLACPNSREGSSLIVGEIWAQTGMVAINTKRHKSFIFRILRRGGTREIAPSHRRYHRAKLVT